MEGRDIDPGCRHEMSWNGLVARRDENDTVPWKDSRMDFYHFTDNLPGKENVVHPIMAHSPSVADVRHVKF